MYQYGEDPIQYLTDPSNGGQIKYVRILHPQTLEEVFYKEVVVNDSNAAISDADVDDVKFIKRGNWYFRRVKSALDVAGNKGIATHSGNGLATSFTIAHGLGAVPSFYQVQAGSAAAAGVSYITADATNITVNYSAAPATGTNNVSLIWAAVV